MYNTYLISWIVVLAIGEFQFGYAMGELSLLQGALHSIYGKDISVEKISKLVSWANTMVPVGATLGSLLAGIVSYYGRRTWIYIANAFVIIGWSICIIPYSSALIVGRLIYGFAVGIFSVIIPIFIIEISPIQLKGSYGGVSQLAITTGIMISYLMGILGRESNKHDNSDSSSTWKVGLIFGLPIIFGIIQLTAITSMFCFESPKYYIIKGNIPKAKEVVSIIYMKYTKTLNSSTETLTLTFEPSNFDPNPDGRTFSSLKRHKYLRAFIVGWMLSLIQQLSGINIIIFYSQNVAIIREGDIFTFTLIIGAVNLISTFACIFALRKFGRKPLLLWGQLAMCAFNWLLFQIYSEKTDEVYARFIEIGVMVLIVCFVIAFASTIGPICWIYLSEIMTEKGMAIAVCLNWLVVIFVSYLPTLSNTLINSKNPNERDLSIFFFLFSGFWIAGFFLISLFVKETKGLSPLEIMTLYKNKEYDPLSQN